MSANARAFAIQAPSDTVWRLLRDEVQAGVETGQARILHEEAPRFLDLEVRMGRGLGVRYTYALHVRDAHTEVVATVAPFGLRYAVANIFALGRGATPYLLAVTQGLANLKAAAEGVSEA